MSLHVRAGASKSSWLRLAGVLCLGISLIGCAERKVRQAANPITPAAELGTYIDLQPGWRVSVITPVLKSGKFFLDTTAGDDALSNEANGPTSTSIKAGTDFLGYERSFYAVEGHKGGVRVRFSNAETIQNGKAELQEKPLQRLFRIPRNARYVRLVYLVRASNADHNMAIVAAARVDDLQSVTREVQADPVTGCQSRQKVVCQWIPRGIAVRPELRRPGTEEWVPAR
jgi:hypothetical protein